jgi:hypothetical protein
VITEDDLHTLRRAGVPESACIVYAAIRGAVLAVGDNTEWIVLTPRVQDALQHGFRWWWRQTEALRAAGFIEVERRRGRIPRYRLTTQPGEGPTL